MGWIILVEGGERDVVSGEKGGGHSADAGSAALSGHMAGDHEPGERWGRHLVHTYLDGSITNFLAALLFAFTLGQIGSSTLE